MKLPIARSLGHLARLPLRLIPPRTVLRVISGPLRGARWIAGSGPNGYWLGTYEREMQRSLVAMVRPGDVVYDLGANAGFYTLLLSRLVGPSGEVVAFEPMPSNAARLREHVSINAVRNVVVVERAVSDVAGAGRFSMAASASEGRLAEGGSEPVLVTTLDDEVFDHGRRPPTLIKMDIEGEEARALDGARRVLDRFRPALWIETHGWLRHEECRERVTRSGYLDILEPDCGTAGFRRIVAHFDRPTADGVEAGSSREA